jgi:hypothetical protein
VLSASQKRAASARKSHDKIYKAVPIEFGIGDYVLHANTYRKNSPKLSATWRGPYHVTATAGPLVFEIEDMLTSAKLMAHATRLRYYADKHLNVSETILDSLITQASTEIVVDKILAYRFDKSALTYEFHVAWLGYQDIEATWEPLSNLVVDVKPLLTDYASSLKEPHRSAILHAIDSYHS